MEWLPTPEAEATENSSAKRKRAREEDTVQTIVTDKKASMDHMYLPEKPQEPLSTDCCGTGCTPCVNDLYQNDLSQWLQLESMTIEERQKWWQEKQKASSASVDAALTPEQFKGFRLNAITQVSHDSFIYSFNLPDGQVTGIGVGQHAIMRLSDAAGRHVTRQYTPISPSHQRGSFDVLIKIYNEGKLTPLLRDVCVGTVVHWRGPFGDFTYKPNQFKQLIMLACGTGIAPMFQVICQVLENEDDYTVMTLLYSSHSQHEILLKDKLKDFSGYWNFKAIYYLSQSSAESLARDKGAICYGDDVKFGRINELALRTEFAQLCATPSTNIQILTCGTKSFDKDMIKYLLNMGHSHERIFKF